jgi:hypothetical protein
MKQIISLVLAFLSFSANGQDQAKEKKENTIRKVQIAPFSSIEARADIHILLLDTDQPGEIYLEGDSTYFDQVVIEVIEGELRIRPRTDRSLKEKFIIEIPVTGLSRITAANKANIVSLNTLQSDGIKIRLDDKSSVALQSTGPIRVTAYSRQ